MTADDLVRRLEQAGHRISELHLEIRTLTQQRTALRKSLRRSRQSRDRWRSLARKRGEKLYNYRRNGKAPWHNVRLSESDVARIMEMPPR